MEVQTVVIRTQRFKYQKYRKTSQRSMCVTQQFQNFDFQWMIPVQIMIFASNSQFLNC